MTKPKVHSISLAILCSMIVSTATGQESWTSRYLKIKKDGKLEYVADSLGNTLPDFSRVGYLQNRKPFPQVPIVKTIQPDGINDQLIIQQAIDEVAQMPLGSNGFRGTILLKKGTYRISGTIKIRTSGIVLRGEGEETKLVAAGKGQRALISANSSGEIKEVKDSRKKISDKYVPVGAKSFVI